MVAEVIVDISNSEVDKIFDYIIPESLNEALGKRVVVPFGNRTIEGYIINIKKNSSLSYDKLKEISYAIDDYSVILPEMIELMNYMVSKYHLKKVDCLKLFITSQMRGNKIKPLEDRVIYLSSDYEIKFGDIRKNAKNQLGIIDYLIKTGKEILTQLAEKFSYSAVKQLIEMKILEIENIERYRAPNYVKDDSLKKIKYTEEQKRAIEGIKENKTYVLHGVTGSGKTEVYMGLIENSLKNNKNAILLVPEISLTPQILSNFKKRFGENVAILHSGLSAGERYDEWRRILFKKARIVVGARSAIFAPITNLGIIIIDEEHEQSYYSESNPRYFTHAIAEFRSRHSACSLVLGSATPSVSTYSKILTGEYELFELPIRINRKELPRIQIVDMLSEIRNGNSGIFSSYLIDALHICMKEKKQAMIFINRRGFSSFMRCRECGYIAKCDDCDVSLVFHKDEEKLKCHFCGKRYKALTACPVCLSKYIRQGAVGTQRVVEELQNMFPDVKILRMDNDSTQTKDSHLRILSEFKDTNPCILVGTQMIAKGHDFKDVTLVGIVDADQSLYQTDYKSTEKTFQLITQVSGRAGRSDEEGRVILQTYVPKHYIYKFSANYDYKGFYNKEANLREVTKFPPFTEIIRILFSGEEEEKVKDITKKHYLRICEIENEYKEDFVYLEVMKSPYARLKNKYRYQILMRIKPYNVDKIISLIYNVCDEIKTGKISCFVEIDPQNLS